MTSSVARSITSGSQGAEFASLSTIEKVREKKTKQQTKQIGIQDRRSYLQTPESRKVNKSSVPLGKKQTNETRSDDIEIGEILGVSVS